MEMYTERVIGLLNDLIEVNNDRIEIYRLVSEGLKNRVLKKSFLQLSLESEQLKKQLAEEVAFLGGTPIETHATSGPLYRAWMDIRVALSGKDIRAILLSSEYGENAALSLYDEALKVNFPVPVNILDFLISQKQKLKRSRSRITEHLNTIAIEK